jgi:hypothetical protein
LAATAAGDPELESALHERLVAPRRAELADRIGRGISAGQASAHLTPGVVADVLMGPLYLRALITGEPIGTDFIESLVDLAISSPAPPHG